MSLSQTFIIAMKLHTSTAHSWANLINEWIASKNGIMAFKPNNVFTSINKQKLNLVIKG
jgi:hypothetical protein